MLYRRLGRSGCEVSVLGFGCMRLPILDSKSSADIFDPNKEINEQEATDMIRYAIDNGINYFDTAYLYHSGKSETFLGKALKHDHDKVMIATKLPTWMVQSPADFERIFSEQLQKLDTKYIDFYLLHALNRPMWYKMKDLGVLSFLDDIVSDGRAKYTGFSFHDDFSIFKEIVDSYDWTLCQIQYNYFDEEFQAGKQGLEYAAAQGLGVVIMEPLRGGKLAQKIPLEIQAIWDSAHTKRTPVEWALRWVWNHPEVSTVLSGMSAMSQIIENIKIVNSARPDSLSSKDLALIRQVKDTYRKMLKVNCTGCGYCMPCPNGVDVPMNFALYNDTFIYKDIDFSMMVYNHMLLPERRASNCAECGECEKHCPQQIKIINELKNVHQRLAQ